MIKLATTRTRRLINIHLYWIVFNAISQYLLKDNWIYPYFLVIYGWIPMIAVLLNVKNYKRGDIKKGWYITYFVLDLILGLVSILYLLRHI